MGNPMLPLYVGSGIFGFLLIVLPLCARKGPNQGIIRCSMILAIISMWLFWAVVYIAQMNPLMGPRLKNTTLIWYKQADLSAEDILSAITAAAGKSQDDKKAEDKASGDEKTDDQKSSDKKSAEKSAEKTAAESAEKKVDDTKSKEEPNAADILRSMPSHCHNQPDNLFECCNIPWLPRQAKAKCIGDSINILKFTCEQARCAFLEAGWLQRSGEVKLLEMISFYNKIGANNPDWAHAIRLIKEECLRANPKHQGIYMDCPEYDISYCTAIIMLKYAPLSNWSTAAACLPPQEFVGECPVCPKDCKGRTRVAASEPTCRACIPFA